MSARLLLLLMLSGCASQRYLTAEEDAELRTACEPKGCVIVPAPLWEQVKHLLGLTDV